MKPLSNITNRDVILLAGPTEIIDGLWKAEFGREIEYVYREIPLQLVYLLRKYGPVIPHWFLVESVQELYAEASGLLSEEKANEYIDDAVRLGLILVMTPDRDRRYRLYSVTDEQLAKFHRIKQGEAKAYALVAEQALDPENLNAGLTKENESWYRNKMRKVMDHDKVYLRDKAKLDKLRYLLAGAVVFALFAMATLWPVLAEATASGGTK
jgi:DNA-binding MarR family transcriptional regulator